MDNLCVPHPLFSVAGGWGFVLFVLPPHRTHTLPSNSILIPPLLLRTKFAHLNPIPGDPGVPAVTHRSKGTAMASLAEAGLEEGMAPTELKRINPVNACSGEDALGEQGW